MGGNALKSGSVRLKTAEYQKLADKLTHEINTNFPNFKAMPIRGFRSKADHGDLDLLVIESSDELTEAMVNSLNPTEIVKAPAKANAVKWGPVTNIGIDVGMDKPFQVDIIQVPADMHHMSYHYYAYNDLGNLMGVVAENAGIRLGHAGLSYSVYDRDNKTKFLGDVFITKNWWEALSLIGYDSEAIHKQFDNDAFESLEDIFETASSSMYFNASMHGLESRSNKSRTRDRKRPTYQAFLEWVKVNEHRLNQYQWNNEKRAEFINGVFEKYPHVLIEKNQLQRDSTNQFKARNKFNSSHISQITGYKGRDLGNFIMKFKAFIDSNTNGITETILTHSFDELKQMVVDVDKNSSSQQNLN